MNAYANPQISSNNSAFGTAPALAPKQGQLTFPSLERQMAEFKAFNDALIDQVGRNFVEQDQLSVQHLLNEHKIVPEILVEAVPYLKRFFGTEPLFALRASLDPSGAATLYAIVMWQGSVQRVRECLDQFDSEWWLTRSGQAAGHLVFTYELI